MNEPPEPEALDALLLPPLEFCKQPTNVTLPDEPDVLL